jgi:hypothetical protein
MAVKLKRKCLLKTMIGLFAFVASGMSLGVTQSAAQSSPPPVSPATSGDSGQSEQRNSGWLDAVERGGPTGPLLGDHSSELGDFHITGFMQNQSGIWVDPTAQRQFWSPGVPHSNSLATERNWIQIDSNYNIGPNSFFLRWWGVYEPPYPNESKIAPSGTATARVYDFSNQYTVRDAWWKLREGRFTLFTGRQIVIWGESLAFRVGDVINPQDLSFAFGFANLEQSRVPVWMIHPIIELPDVGPFASNDIEGVFVPSLQPLYTNNQYGDNRQYGRQNSMGSTDILPPTDTGARFDGRPYPLAFPGQNPALPLDSFAFPQIVGVPGPIHWYFPNATWANSEEGIRFHTFLSDAELAAFYWHSHQLAPSSYVNGPVGHQFISERFPQLNDVGVTGNRPLYLPGRLGEMFPFVLRAEGVLQDRSPFNTQELSAPTAVVSSSTINTLVALDLDSAYAPWLTQTGTLESHFEWNNYTILSFSKQMVFPDQGLHLYHNDENFLLSLGSSWLWNEIAPTFTGIYNPDGTTIELFPDLLLTPHWSDKYNLDFKYIAVFGNNKYGGDGGLFKGKSLFVWTFQYNFNLL